MVRRRATFHARPGALTQANTAPAMPPMTAAPPPADAWLWLQAWQETWLAGLDRSGTGARLRAQRLARLIETALRDSPLYARRARGAQQLADFEPVGKTELMQHFDDWATDRRITREGVENHLRSADVADAWLGRYLVWTSSGTTGQPGIFVQDAASLAAYDAIDALRLRGSTAFTQSALGLWGLGRRFAYVGALGGHYAGHVSLQRLRRIVPAPWTPQVEMFSVLEPLEQLAEQLQALQPDVLITYPSCAVALAAHQARGTLQLRLSELWLGGEQLGAVQRELLTRAFGCPLRNSYGASEFYAIAFECTHGRLHLNDDWVLLEGVDAQGRAVAPGEFSHTTWLTHLANRTQPLLRYELTDRVRFDAQPCPCGAAFPAIGVQGRSDDALSLPGRHGDPVTLLPLVLESVIEEDAGVTRFQLLRRRDGVLEVRLPTEGGDQHAAFEACCRALQACFARQGVKPVRLCLGDEPPQRHAGSGKLRRVIDLQRKA
jgi:phenylacetate-CoA ligase